MLLNNQEITEEIKEEIKKQLEAKRIIKEYYEPLYTHRSDNLDELDKYL